MKLMEIAMGSKDFFKKQKLNEVSKRKEEERLNKGSILIVCEGTKTEPNYFKSFRTIGIRVEVIGAGRNTKSLVQYSKKEWKEFKGLGKTFETVWIVMDKDSFEKITMIMPSRLLKVR